MKKETQSSLRRHWPERRKLAVIGFGLMVGIGVGQALAQTKPAAPVPSPVPANVVTQPTPVPVGKKGLPGNSNSKVVAPTPTPRPPAQGGTPAPTSSAPAVVPKPTPSPVSNSASSSAQVPAQTPAPPPAPTKPAQTKPTPEPETGGDTFRISSNLVAVPVSVIDSQGEPVRNLRAEEFRLEEEGQPQQLQSLGEPGKTPLELALLFDVSGSVRERFEFEKNAATRFLQQVLKSADKVAVFSIGFEPKMISARSGDLAAVTESLKQLQPTKEGTAVFDTIVRASRYLSDSAAPGSRRVLVIISDGEDNHSEDFRLADAQRELQRSDTVFYAINPSGPSIRLNKISMRGHNGLTELANDTGGTAFLPDQEVELERVFKQIAAELQAQYLLGYYSSNETNDGKFRRIKIQLPTHPVLRVRARQGYYAPRD